jgi:hypothetical protein
MNTQTNQISAETFAALYYEGVCVRTGRKGIRPSFNGDVTAEEWRSPDGTIFWHETGYNPDPRIGRYEGFRQSFPEDCRTDLIGVDLPAADPELDFTEPIDDWDPVQSLNWDRTQYYTAEGETRPYPYNNVRYACCERFRSAGGCICAARDDANVGCVCPDECFDDSYEVWWLGRVRRADGTPAWQECKEPVSMAKDSGIRSPLS